MANFKIRIQDSWHTDKCPICHNRYTEEEIKELVIVSGRTDHIFKMCNDCMIKLRDVLEENIEDMECTACGGSGHYKDGYCGQCNGKGYIN